MTILAAVVLGLIVYAPAIKLPLFLDDAPQFRWLAGVNIRAIWDARQIASYYRPVPFTVFKLLWLLQGGYHAPTLHALVVLLHIVNGILIGLVARRLTRNPWSGPLAAALLILFPFAYQAVLWVTSVFHVALLTSTLGVILLSLCFLDSGSWLALVGAWITAFLGIFSHENGVLMPALIGITLLGIGYNEKNLRTNWRRLILIVIPTAGIAALYLFAWAVVPKGNDFLHGLQFDAFDAKLAYVAQSLIYPLSALARPLINNSETIIPTIALLLVFSLGAVFGSLWFTTRTLAPLINALIGLLWLIISAVPTVFLLTTNYVIGSPRLLYLGGAGVALFWTAWAAGLARYRIGRIAGAVTALGFAVIGLVFGLQRMDAHLRIGNFYQQFAAEVKQQSDGPILLVNAPSYIAPPTEKTTFLVGSEGATLLSGYISLADLVWVNTNQELPVSAVAFANTLAQNPWEIFFPSGSWLSWEQLDEALGKAQSIYTVSLSRTEFHPLRVGDKPSDPSSARPLADFGSVILWKASIAQSPAAMYPLLTLEWEVRQPVQAVPFVHILCDGALAAQADGPPLGGLHPFDRWKPGERWADHRELHRLCPVEVGLYNARTGTRYAARLEDGSSTDSVVVPNP